MSTLVLIRHGETDWAGRFCGQIDPPLNEAGQQQTAHMAAEVESLGITRICASPLLRARQTAQRIERQLGLPVEFHPELREISFGAWEGLHWSEIEARWPREARLWAEEFPHRTAPEGESYADFCLRVDRCVASIAAFLPSPMAIVTHRGVMQRVLTRYFEYSEEQARERTALYCATVKIEFDSAKGLR